MSEGKLKELGFDLNTNLSFTERDLKKFIDHFDKSAKDRAGKGMSLTFNYPEDVKFESEGLANGKSFVSACKSTLAKTKDPYGLDVLAVQFEKVNKD